MSEDMQQQINSLKTNFNTYALTLSTFLANIAPQSSFVSYNNLMKPYIVQNSNKVIDMFVMYILTKYEDKILEGDEDFFLGRNYKDEHNGDSNGIMKVFEFKSLWGDLTEQNKSAIKEYMKILCQISRAYVNLLCELKTLNKQSFNAR